MTLCESIGIRRGDVLSVVGAGGKTTLIFRLARELRAEKTLVTTTTKMYFPGKDEYDCLFIDEPPEPVGAGVYFLSGRPDKDGKATAYADLARVLPGFDYVLIEADGARGKLLKGWAGHEPAVIPETTKTLGVLNLGLLGSAVTPENIHRVDEYMRLTGARLGDTVTVEQLRRLATDGLFKNAAGEKILCIAGLSQAGSFPPNDRSQATSRASNPYNLEGADKCVILS